MHLRIHLLLTGTISIATACSNPAPVQDAATDAPIAADSTDVAPEAAADVANDTPPRTDNPVVLWSGTMRDGTAVATNLIFMATVAGPGQPCRIEEIDGCLVGSCSGAFGDAGGPVITSLSAGDIVVRGRSGELLDSVPDPSGFYVDNMVPRMLWSADDQVSFSGSGGRDLPAFAVTLANPPATMFTVPAPTVATVDIDRTMALQFSWSAGAGDVAFGVNQGRMSTDPIRAVYDSTRILCVRSASAGSASIPATLLSRMRATTATLLSNVYFGSVVRRIETPGGYRTHVMLFNGQSRPATFF